jgi:hypothetical protein
MGPLGWSCSFSTFVMYERAAPILRANVALGIFLAVRNSLTLFLIRITPVTVAYFAY